MVNIARGNQKIPPHPGSFIKEKVIQLCGLSVTEAAQALGVTRPALSALINERANLSPEMALRLEKAFGFSMEKLMLMQNKYEVALTRQREAEIMVIPFSSGYADKSRKVSI